MEGRGEFRNIYKPGLRSDGTVVLWGNNYFDPVGPTNVPPGLSNVVEIATGYAHELRETEQERTELTEGEKTIRASTSV